jgi:hypothetical protein
MRLSIQAIYTQALGNCLLNDRITENRKILLCGIQQKQKFFLIKTYISLFEKIFLELLEIILTNQSGIFELPPTGLKILVHRAGGI